MVQYLSIGDVAEHKAGSGQFGHRVDQHRVAAILDQIVLKNSCIYCGLIYRSQIFTFMIKFFAILRLPQGFQRCWIHDIRFFFRLNIIYDFVNSCFIIKFCIQEIFMKIKYLLKNNKIHLII